MALVTAHNWMSNRRIPAPLYVPANVAVAGALIGLGRWGGAGWEDLGLGRQQLRSGLAAAATVGAVASTVVTRAAASPRAGRWFADDRALLLSPRAATYEALIRIPLGTALAEELTFRGALLGLSLRHRPWPASVAWTSAAFGLWHILPTIDTLPKHTMGRDALERGRSNHAVGFAVASTTAAGAGLALLRWATGSVVTPVAVHAVVNATALLQARRRLAGRP